MNIKAGYVNNSTENTSIYINGLSLEIQYEINVLSHNNGGGIAIGLDSGRELARKQAGRGKSAARGRGKQTNIRRSTAPRDRASSSSP